MRALKGLLAFAPFAALFSLSPSIKGTTNSVTIADSFAYPIPARPTPDRPFNYWVYTNKLGPGYHLGEDYVIPIPPNGTAIDTEIPIYAAGNGIVKYAAPRNGYGWVVIVEHTLPQGDPLGPIVTTLYGHLRKNGIIATGTAVIKGVTILGYLSSNSQENGGYSFTHLHLAVRHGSFVNGCDATSKGWTFAGYSTLFTSCGEGKIISTPTDLRHATIVANFEPASEFIKQRVTPTEITQATLDGNSWSGSVDYSIVGPQGVIIGNTVPGTTVGLQPGNYTLSYHSGGPPNSTLLGISPCVGPLLAICTASLSPGQTLYFGFVFASLASSTFTETFNNAPDYTNNWQVWYNYGSTQTTYTLGNLRVQAARANPYPPGSSIAFLTNHVFTGDVDFSVELNHQGKGRTVVGLWAADAVPLGQCCGWIVSAHLDTDDTNYLSLGAAYGTDWKYAGTPYMNRWVTIRIKTEGNLVNFYADGVLLETIPFGSPPGDFRLGFAVGSVPWKSGDNDTSFRLVTAAGTIR